MQRAWRKRVFIFVLSVFSFFVHGAELDKNKPNLDEIRIVPVDPTPESENVKVNLTFPKSKEVKEVPPVLLQVRLDGYSLGTSSNLFLRAKELYNDEDGQSLHVYLDDRPYIPIYEAFLSSLDDSEEYYDETVVHNLPTDLEPGMHVLRMFPVRSFNESLKGDGCFVSRIFYFKEKKNTLNVNLENPYLTYNQPEGKYTYRAGQPILLDFYITNCQLSKDGYKVRVTIDKDNSRLITQWIPYYIYGLRKGKHTVHLELLDPTNRRVSGMFSENTQEIILE